MSSAASDAYRAELDAMLSVLVLPLEGLHYDDRLAPAGEVSEEIDGDITQYERRQRLIQTVLAAMDALDADGYPEMPIEELPPSIYDVLEHQAEAILAALGRFRRAAEAVAVAAEGELVPKDTVMLSGETPEPQV
jgi:hypothetical protein